MTKADLVDRVHQSIGLSRKEALELVELSLEIVKETLQRGENVKISGFGTFFVRRKKARKGRNPQSGEEFLITPRTVVIFKPSRLLRTAIDLGV